MTSHATSRPTSAALTPASGAWFRASLLELAAYVGMNHDTTLTFTPVDHPDGRVRRVGFDLTDPYVEQCWTAVVGPSSALLLRRMPALWVARVPAQIEAGELSRSLGLGGGTGNRSRFANTLERVVQFGLARRVGDFDLDLYRQVAPLSPRQLERVPEWTAAAHERLFGAHLAQLEAHDRAPDQLGQVTARLDRLQRSAPPISAAVASRTGGLAT